jgi:mannitol/fructose-specific phosphotransferase system IIA component (Ntr-type)
MKLEKYLRPDCIRIGMKAEDKWGAIDELLDLLVRRGLIADAETVRRDLVAREKKMSTGMEFGLALPHAKSRGAKEMAIALGIKKEGIDFDSLDKQPAQVVFLVVSRTDTTGPHIQCLADIARLYRDETLRQRLPAVASPAAALALLAGA